MKPAPLRRRLLLLAAAAILPLAVMSGIALQALLDQQRHQAEESSLNLARALATAVDTELRLTISALQSLALTDPLGSPDQADLEAAHRFAQRVLASRPEWRAILLADADGKPLFNTSQPFAGPPARIAEPESLFEVVRTGAPVVGALTSGGRGNLGIPVRVPVLQDGRVRYVLSAVVRPEAILRVIHQQRIPDDWIVSVFDGRNLRVARSREHERFVGVQPRPSLLALMNLGNRDEAVGETTPVEGGTYQSAVARVHSTHWTVALSVPATVRAMTLRDSALAYGGGILLSLGIGGLAAWRLSRNIATPIASLRDAAAALGRGDAVLPIRTDVVEVEAVSEALVAAAAQRRDDERERETLLEAERDARAGAEAAQARLQQLVTAGALLSRSLEEESTLAAIGSVIVPQIADICRIDLLDKDGVLQRKLTHHVDPDREKAMLEFVASHVSTADSPGSFNWVVATAQTFLANLPDDHADTYADPTFAAFVRDFHLKAACVVPLVARGRTIGAMCALQAESGRRFSDADGALVVELAQRAALALDNVRLFGESRDALRDAEIANRAKDEFLAMLGHELRNPLAPMVTALEVLARREGRGNRERQIIERQVAHLSRMVDDLLDVSRIASGKVELRRAAIDLRDVVARALELTEPVLQARSSAPEVRMPEAPVRVSGDAVRLAQVVGNLLTNAAKFSPRDGRIVVALTSAEGYAQIAVSDEGEGIPAELLPHVFDRFVQGGQALQRASGGLGLGLAIAKNLVELHGGEITAESEGSGHGARIALTLPLLASSAAADASPSSSARAELPASRARILIVDDNDDAAQSLAVILRLEGHDVCTARDGEEALRLLDEFVPDAAVLDIGLPKMNGYELAAALRADPRTQHVPLVALTGYGRAPDRRRAIDAGFDEHLVKPVEIDALLTTLQRLLADAAAVES